MTYLKTTLIVIFFFTIFHNLTAQHSEALQEFYQKEQKTWQEFIAASQKFKNSNSPIDINFYHIDVEISIHTPFIAGSVLCKFYFTEDNTNLIKLNLHQSFTVDSITGNVGSFNFINDSIYISLDSTYHSGDSAIVKVYYKGIPQQAGGYKGLRYETHMTNEPIIASLSTPFLAHYWWPCKDGPGDKPDSVYIDITIPDTTVAGLPLTAVSNGVLENTITSNGKKTFYWRERYPIVPYYVMVAISNYTHFQQTCTVSTLDSFPIDYYVFSEHLSSARSGVSQLPQVMDLFSNYFGTYPFAEEKYAMTQIGFYGAIENQTNTIQNNMSISWFGVSVHELAHMWFGDMITCETWQHGWLNEGFATYSEALWEESVGGFSAYQSKIRNKRYWSGGTLFLQNVSDPFNIFIRIIYDKGAYVLHMLRGVLGDSIFFDCLYNYATDSTFIYDHATTEDFQAICESISGMDLTFFFDQWIYDEYYPKYNFGYSQNSSTLRIALTIEQTQHQDGWRTVFEMPIQLQFNFSDNTDTLVTVWNDAQTQSYAFNFGKTLTEVLFDPDEWILRTYQLSGIVEDEVKPIKFELFQNYPNPFNSSTQIKFSLPEIENVSLMIYNTLGQEVAQLVSDHVMNPGIHTYNWDASGIASGVYYYVMQYGTNYKVKKLLLLK